MEDPFGIDANDLPLLSMHDEASLVPSPPPTCPCPPDRVPHHPRHLAISRPPHPTRCARLSTLSCPPPHPRCPLRSTFASSACCTSSRPSAITRTIPDRSTSPTPPSTRTGSVGLQTAPTRRRFPPPPLRPPPPARLASPARSRRRWLRSSHRLERQLGGARAARAARAPRLRMSLRRRPVSVTPPSPPPPQH